ncbi:hypothetical protein TrVGV298_002006 [Trichoderma virens]|nr:hypothetical protein TrVGV298_002006 [Trichoderma virens]
MFRPRRSAGQAGPPEAPAAEDTHQPKFHSMQDREQLNTPATSASRVTQQTMFRSARNMAPATTAPAASASRTAHQDMPQLISQPGNNARPNQTISTQAFRRPPRFLMSARGNSELTNASTASTSRATRPAPRLIDSIESDGTDGTPPPANASATSSSRVTRPASRFVDRIESDGTPPPANASATSSSRITRPPSRLVASIDFDGIPPSANASATSSSRITRPPSRLVDSIEFDDIPPPANASATPSSRITRPPSRLVASIESDGTPLLPPSRNIQQPILQHVRNTGPPSLGSVNMPSTSTTRGPRPFPLPGRIETGPTTALITTAPRTAQQPMLQPTRNAIPAHAPTVSAPRVALQSTAQPTRTLPAQNPSASSSRTSQQAAFRPVRAAAVPANAPAPPASASILEFICLYTHDLRRKKKRWQDGKLKFHTFNKKYMVYDESGSFVGDGHWQGEEGEFAEGLEMSLDRGMAIVQVLECTGSKEQDLGEVLGKRAREVEERRVNAAAKNPASTASSNPAKRSRGVAVVVRAAPSSSTTAAAIPPPPLLLLPLLLLPGTEGHGASMPRTCWG